MANLTREEHIKRHRELHRALDELSADFITHTEKKLGETTILELLWYGLSNKFKIQQKRKDENHRPIFSNYCRLDSWCYFWSNVFSLKVNWFNYQ